MSNLAMYHFRLSHDSSCRLSDQESEIVERERSELSRTACQLDLALRSVSELLMRVDDDGLDQGECVNLSELLSHLAESIHQCHEKGSLASDIVTWHQARSAAAKAGAVA